MVKNNKQLLYERFNHLDASFRFPLKESDDKKFYLMKLNEEVENSLFEELSAIFNEHNKLSGNIENDTKYLKEFIALSEEEDFDPYAHLRNTEKIDEKEDCVLTISPFNDKLDHPYLSLPAGYTCPFANICKTKVPRNRKRDPKTGLLVQDFGDIRCYGASEEAMYPHAQEMRWTNLDLLNKFDMGGKIDLILRSLKFFEQVHGKIDVFRVHESGDFYKLEYFDAWLEVARQRPDILFYEYTKSLPFWVKRMKEIPENFKLVASVGGTKDELISKHDLKHSVIVNSPEEAINLRLPIDIDDTMAYKHEGNFALLLHGAQQAGEKAKQSYKNRQTIKDLKHGKF